MGITDKSDLFLLYLIIKIWCHFCHLVFWWGEGRADGLCVYVQCRHTLNTELDIQNHNTGMPCLDAASSWRCLISCAPNFLIINFPRHSKLLFCTFPAQNSLDKTCQILYTRGSSGANKTLKLEVLPIWITSTITWERRWKASEKDRNQVWAAARNKQLSLLEHPPTDNLIFSCSQIQPQQRGL